MVGKEMVGEVGMVGKENGGRGGHGGQEKWWAMVGHVLVRGGQLCGQLGRYGMLSDHMSKIVYS
jgi:hypothetical protein